MLATSAILGLQKLKISNYSTIALLMIISTLFHCLSTKSE